MLTRRTFLASAPSLLLAKNERPNVLFIAADDMNNALGCYGHPLVKTPNLDRLARMGTRFDRAYCNFPLCGPSRTSLLSGRRPDSTRIWANQIAVRDTMPDIVTLPQCFRNAGYQSLRYGKMYHMDVPGSVGTNKWDDPASWNTAISPPGLEDKTPGPGRKVTPKPGPGNAFQWIAFPDSDREQADRRAAELAMETIGKEKNPWFMGLGFLRPHVPDVAPARFFDLYPLDRIKPFVNPPGDVDDIPVASEMAVTGRNHDMGMNEADKREALRGYFASVSYMDSLVGEVLNSLEKAGQLEKTVIAFWGDHGWHLGEHHRWQKRSLFEESARVPLIVHAPGRRGRGKSSRAFVELVDLYPTLTELAGVPAPGGLEGQSFAPVLDKPGRAWKTAAFTQMYGPEKIVGRAVRTDRYRYIRWEGPHPDEELFDHRSDPHEFRNLARGGEHDGALRMMRGVLDAGWQAARARV